MIAVSQTRGCSISKHDFPLLETPDEHEIIQNMILSALYVAAQKRALTSFIGLKELKIKN